METIISAAYLRKSRAEEKTDTLEEVLERHEKILSEYAEKNNIVIAKTYKEVISGESIFARPQMLQLLQDIEDGNYDAVLCMDIDRLGRGGMKDQGIILDALKYSDTLIITPDKTYDLNDETDEELTEFKTFIARRELKITKKRLQRGLKETIKEGGYVANAPFGYTKIYKDKKPTLEINEEEAYYVRMMFNMYTQGIGCHTIAETLNSLGVKPRRSDKFSRTSVRHILKNPTFIGKVAWNKKKNIRKGSQGNEKNKVIYNPKEEWTIVEGMHPAIVDEVTFKKAQQIFDLRYIPPSNDGTVKSSLAGLVRCNKCGNIMQRMGAHQGSPYLLCNTKGCVASTKFDLVEQAMLDQLASTLKQLQMEHYNKPEADTSQLEKALIITQKETAKVLMQKDNLHNLLEQGVYDVATFWERSAAVTSKLEILKEQEKATTELIEKTKNQNKILVVQKLRSVLDAYSVADASQRNMLLKNVIESISYNKEKKSKPEDFTLTISLRFL